MKPLTEAHLAILRRHMINCAVLLSRPWSSIR